ncbi:MAG TPA: MoaD/ThiS family protein [Aggregatilineales bacterium]|nr:MoaD/ThiS family protein [Anaerolineales bacterium]HRE48978.1 MoaD/ThiS family protein [Aggregatilineales bacterium]
MIELHLTFYGVLKQEMGIRTLVFTLLDPAPTIADMAERLKAYYPTLSERLVSVAYAVNDVLVHLSHPLQSGDQVALLPPVSGG